MNKPKALLATALAFVLLLGGAYLLYDRLSENADPDRLAVQSGVPTQPPAGETEDPRETLHPTDDAQAETPQPTDEVPEETPRPTDDAQEEAQPQRTMAPDFTVYDLEGNPVRLSDHFGTPIVLNFWASWCGPCQTEMPDFNEAWAELGGAVQFLMVNVTSYRETVETASSFIAERGYTFPVFYDTDSDAATTYGAYSLPTTYFIDGEGCLIARAIGMIDRATLQRGIDMILPAGSEG